MCYNRYPYKKTGKFLRNFALSAQGLPMGRPERTAGGGTRSGLPPLTADGGSRGGANMRYRPAVRRKKPALKWAIKKVLRARRRKSLTK